MCGLVWDQGVQGSNPCTPTTHERAVERQPVFISEDDFKRRISA